MVQWFYEYLFLPSFFPEPGGSSSSVCGVSVSVGICGEHFSLDIVFNKTKWFSWRCVVSINHWIGGNMLHLTDKYRDGQPNWYNIFVTIFTHFPLYSWSSLLYYMNSSLQLNYAQLKNYYTIGVIMIIMRLFQSCGGLTSTRAVWSLQITPKSKLRLLNGWQQPICLLGAR